MTIPLWLGILLIVLGALGALPIVLFLLHVVWKEYDDIRQVRWMKRWKEWGVKGEASFAGQLRRIIDKTLREARARDPEDHHAHAWAVARATVHYLSRTNPDNPDDARDPDANA